MKSAIAYLPLIGVLSIGSLSAELHSEQIFPTRAIGFVNPPRLLHTSTTSNNISAPATYYFTIALPPDAREPLQRITVTQVNSGQRIRFYPQQTRVFQGTRQQLTTLLPSETVAAQNSLSVTLNPAIAPGTTLTLALRPVRNPDQEGTYFLGITTFPAGDKVDSQFIGFGRFQFQRSDGAE